MIDFRFLYEMDIPHRAVAVYQYLFFRANEDGQCWPSVPRIARDIKLSERTVRRAIGELREAGLIETEQQYRMSGGKSSLLFTIVKKR